MSRLIGGDVVGGGGGILGHDGQWGWWGFAFIIFIVFAIILAFVWMRSDRREGGGWEAMIPTLMAFLGKGKIGGDDHGHEMVKDLAQDTGKIIHNADMRAYDLKASMDNNAYKLERRIDEVENTGLKETIAALRQELSDKKVENVFGHGFGILDRKVEAIKEHFKPGWFHSAAGACG